MGKKIKKAAYLLESTSKADVQTEKTRHQKAHFIKFLKRENIYQRKDELLIEQFLSKVIMLRKIENTRQMYEQLPYIKKYMYDSFNFGILGQLPRMPTESYLQELIEKRVQ